MKRLLKNLLWLPAMIACGLTQMPAAVAPLRLARPSTQFTSCNPNLLVESVKYLGRNNGKDSVQVVFKGLAPGLLSGGINNVPVTSCGVYGVPPVSPSSQFQGGLNNTSPAFGGVNVTFSQNFGYELTVRVSAETSLVQQFRVNKKGEF